MENMQAEINASLEITSTRILSINNTKDFASSVFFLSKFL